MHTLSSPSHTDTQYLDKSTYIYIYILIYETPGQAHAVSSLSLSFFVGMWMWVTRKACRRNDAVKLHQADSFHGEYPTQGTYDGRWEGRIRGEEDPLYCSAALALALALVVPDIYSAFSKSLDASMCLPSCGSQVWGGRWRVPGRGPWRHTLPSQ